MGGLCLHRSAESPREDPIRTLRVVAAVLLGLSLLVVGFVQYRRQGNHTSRQSARMALLSRQNHALLALAKDAEEGTLLDFKSILVVVDQRLVQDLLSAASPMDADIGGGFHVNVDGVQTVFGDGVALVQLTGTAVLNEAPVGARVTVFGSIDAVEIEPTSGILRCNVSILAVEAENAAALGRNDPVGRLTEALTEGGLAMLLGPLEIPVKLENSLAIPAVESKRLRIPKETLPLSVAAHRIKVFGGKLWVFVDAGLAGPLPSAVAAQ